MHPTRTREEHNPEGTPIQACTGYETRRLEDLAPDTARTAPTAGTRHGPGPAPPGAGRRGDRARRAT